MNWDTFRVDGESEAHLLRELQTDGPSAKTGRPAKYKLGVNYVGGWETMHDGVATAVRKHACALRGARIPVFLQSESYTHSNFGITTTVERHTLPKPVLDEVGDMAELDHEDTALVIRHTVPTQSTLEGIIYPRGAKFMSSNSLKIHRERSILYAAFEEDIIPKQRVRILNLFGGIWVPSSASKQWLKQSGVTVPIKVIYHPFRENDPVAKIPPKRQGRVYRFLNISKWEPRKAQHDLIGGFLLAFCPEDPVELIMKCNPFMRCADYPSDWRESLKAWLETDEVQSRGWSAQNVLLKVRVFWNKMLSREQMAQMYVESDAYVSCGRSEGFDLPAFDAKLANRRLIHPNNGAAWDYRQSTDVQIKSNGFERFHPWYKFKDATWPDFDANDVATALKSAYEIRDSAPVLGLDRKKFTMQYVGDQMREAAVEVAPELAEVFE